MCMFLGLHRQRMCILQCNASNVGSIGLYVRLVFGISEISVLPQSEIQISEFYGFIVFNYFM